MATQYDPAESATHMDSQSRYGQRDFSLPPPGRPALSHAHPADHYRQSALRTSSTPVSSTNTVPLRAGREARGSTPIPRIPSHRLVPNPTVQGAGTSALHADHPHVERILSGGAFEPAHHQDSIMRQLREMRTALQQQMAMMERNQALFVDHLTYLAGVMSQWDQAIYSRFADIQASQQRLDAKFGRPGTCWCSAHYAHTTSDIATMEDPEHPTPEVSYTGLSERSSRASHCP